MPSEIFLLIMSTFVGLLFIVISIPLIRKKVPPNKWYGFRIYATFYNENVWYETNKRFAKDMFKLGVLVIIAGFALLFAPMPILGKVIVFAIIVESGIIAIIIRAWRYANYLLEQHKHTSNRGNIP